MCVSEDTAVCRSRPRTWEEVDLEEISSIGISWVVEKTKIKRLFLDGWI